MKLRTGVGVAQAVAMLRCWRNAFWQHASWRHCACRPPCRRRSGVDRGGGGHRGWWMTSCACCAWTPTRRPCCMSASPSTPARTTVSTPHQRGLLLGGGCLMAEVCMWPVRPRPAVHPTARTMLQAPMLQARTMVPWAARTLVTATLLPHQVPISSAASSHHAQSLRFYVAVSHPAGVALSRATLGCLVHAEQGATGAGRNSHVIHAASSPDPQAELQAQESRPWWEHHSRWLAADSGAAGIQDTCVWLVLISPVTPPQVHGTHFWAGCRGARCLNPAVPVVCQAKLPASSSLLPPCLLQRRKSLPRYQAAASGCGDSCADYQICCSSTPFRTLRCLQTSSSTWILWQPMPGWRQSGSLSCSRSIVSSGSQSRTSA